MRGLIALILIFYFVGVGAVLTPTVEANWNSATTAEFASRVGQDLPDALAWPARLYRNIPNRD